MRDTKFTSSSFRSSESAGAPSTRRSLDKRKRRTNLFTIFHFYASDTLTKFLCVRQIVLHKLEWNWSPFSFILPSINLGVASKTMLFVGEVTGINFVHSYTYTRALLVKVIEVLPLYTGSPERASSCLDFRFSKPLKKLIDIS